MDRRPEKIQIFLLKKIISDAEKELMNSLYKGRLYESHLNTIPQITAENLQNIIQEEKKEIEDYDIADLVKELKISFYADKFYEKQISQNHTTLMNCTHLNQQNTKKISLTHI